MTLNFIYLIVFIIIVYDIIAKIIQHKKEGIKLGLVTITSVFRKWFKEKPLVPFMLGGVFIGHFGVYEWNNILPDKISIIVFLILSGLMSIYFIIEMLIKQKGKFYNLMCRFWFIPMIIGILIGSFWR